MLPSSRVSCYSEMVELCFGFKISEVGMIKRLEPGVKLLVEAAHACAGGKFVGIESLISCCSAYTQLHTGKQCDISSFGPFAGQQMLKRMGQSRIRSSGGIDPHIDLRRRFDIHHINRSLRRFVNQLYADDGPVLV